MIRYFAIATVIVLAVLVAATAWTHRDAIRDRIAAGNVPASPKAMDETSGGARANVPLSGDAPWALSALPDCTTPGLYAHGPFAYVRAKLPRDAVAIAPGTTFAFGACTISVGNGEIRVQRGLDRLRIPPLATLYRSGDGLVLLRRTGKVGELRVYERPTIQP
ncbi:MAG TPA: hypothetical protein VNF68_09815 [Candidatus Baltobacteraceae bacterium]|nr:hypothetical protein [Candidatus Baltobacteraceae bacterium]